MIKSPLLAIAALLLLSQNAMAGWYKVENYVGSVGSKPVHLSLQTYDFGSGISVQGSYYFDAERSPAVLYGTISGSDIRLCQIEGEDQFREVIVYGSATPLDLSACPLSLTLDANGAIGNWGMAGESLPVALDRVARLDDTGAGEIDGMVEIPFWEQTATHMFSGVYTKTDGSICMDRMRVIDKATGRVDQEIAFASDPCDAGAVMTPIYWNVGTYQDGKMQLVVVNYRDGGAGHEVDYAVDPNTGLLTQRE